MDQPVSPARRDGEDLQWRVGHEAGVGVSELALPVDEHALWILTDVYGQPTRESLGGIFVHPIAEKHHVRGEIVVVEMAVGVSGRRLSDHDAAVEAVHFLQACVSVPKVGAGISCDPLISTEKIN